MILAQRGSFCDSNRIDLDFCDVVHNPRSDPFPVKWAAIAGLSLLMATLASGSAFAQVSLAGEWSPRYHEDQPDRIPGPDLGDYTGLPLTDGARLAADSWDAARLTLREHQCKVHISPYIYHGPLQVRIWERRIRARSR